MGLFAKLGSFIKREAKDLGDAAEDVKDKFDQELTKREHELKMTPSEKIAALQQQASTTDAKLDEIATKTAGRGSLADAVAEVGEIPRDPTLPNITHIVLPDGRVRSGNDGGQVVDASGTVHDVPLVEAPSADDLKKFDAPLPTPPTTDAAAPVDSAPVAEDLPNPPSLPEPPAAPAPNDPTTSDAATDDSAAAPSEVQPAPPAPLDAAPVAEDLPSPPSSPEPPAAAAPTETTPAEEPAPPAPTADAETAADLLPPPPVAEEAEPIDAATVAEDLPSPPSPPEPPATTAPTETTTAEEPAPPAPTADAATVAEDLPSPPSPPEPPAASAPSDPTTGEAAIDQPAPAIATEPEPEPPAPEVPVPAAEDQSSPNYGKTPAQLKYERARAAANDLLDELRGELKDDGEI